MYTLGQSQTPWDTSVSEVDLPYNQHFNRWGPISGLGDIHLPGGVTLPAPGQDVWLPGSGGPPAPSGGASSQSSQPDNTLLYVGVGVAALALFAWWYSRR